MRIRIQTKLGEHAYSVNEQTMDLPDSATADEIGIAAKALVAANNAVAMAAGCVPEKSSPSSPVGPQAEEEMKMIKKQLNVLNDNSERKTMYINELKRAVGESRSKEILDTLKASADWNKVGLHNDD